MKPSSLIAAFNRLPVWRQRLRVWGFTVTAPTFDRWLYLWMHRAGRMGREEAAFFQRVIRPGMQVADVGANIGLYSLLLARCDGASFADEQQAMRKMFDKLAAVKPGDPLQEHPAFGVLSHDAYGVLMARHTDHHLKQFGV